MSEGIHFNTESIMEDLDDLKIKLALLNYMDLEGKSLLEENKVLQKDDFFSLRKDTKQRFQKSINRHYYKKHAEAFLRIGRRIISKAAVVLFFIFVSLSIPVFSVEAIRTRVLNLILDVNDKYTSVKLNQEDDNLESTDLNIPWTEAYAPTRIPEGYEVSSMSDKSVKSIQFNNAEGSMILFQQWVYGSTINIDTENADNTSKVTIQGNEGMLAEKGEVVTITWSNDAYIFVITIYRGGFSQEEMLDIAESVGLVN